MSAGRFVVLMILLLFDGSEIIEPRVSISVLLTRAWRDLWIGMELCVSIECALAAGVWWGIVLFVLCDGVRGVRMSDWGSGRIGSSCYWSAVV